MNSEFSLGSAYSPNDWSFMALTARYAEKYVQPE